MEHYLGFIKYLVDIEYHNIKETITCDAIHLVKASNADNARKALVEFFEEEYKSVEGNAVLIEARINQTIVGK